jgi:hypothetical protein
MRTVLELLVNEKIRPASLPDEKLFRRARGIGTSARMRGIVGVLQHKAKRRQQLGKVASKKCGGL